MEQPSTRRAFALAILSTAVTACSGQEPQRCAIDVPRLATGRLHTSGINLRDELGRLVFLRGFNAGSRSKWAPYAPFEFALPDPDGSHHRKALAAYIDGATDMGPNVLRVPFHWAAVEPKPGADDDAYLAHLDLLLEAAWVRGFRTILDFHQDVYAENFCGDGFPAWTIDAAGGPPPAPHHDCPRWFEAYSSAPVQAAFDRFWADGGGVQSQYVALWKRMLARYRDRPGVIGFEPMNEPSPGSADSASFEQTTLTAFHSRMAGVVNEAAPDALVFFDPLGMTSATHTTRLALPSGRNLVYAPHYYQPATIFGGTGNDKQLVHQLTTLKAPADAWGVPTFIGEWGAGNEASDATDYVEAHLAAFNELGLSGTQWEYSVTAERWNGEPLNVVFPDGKPRRMVQFGWARPMVRALAGTLIEMSYDADTGRFSLRYQPSAATGEGAVTEIGWNRISHEWFVESLEGACLDYAVVASLVDSQVRIRATGSDEVRVTLAVVGIDGNP